MCRVSPPGWWGCLARAGGCGYTEGIPARIGKKHSSMRPAGTMSIQASPHPDWDTTNYAFEAMLTGESPQSVLWPLVHTWTLSAAVLSPERQSGWMAACETLGLAGEAFNERMEGLDHFLDTVEEALENMAARQGIDRSHLWVPRPHGKIGRTVDNCPKSVDNPRGKWISRSIVRNMNPHIQGAGLLK